MSAIINTMIALCYSTWVVICAPPKKNIIDEITSKYKSKTGEPIAVDNIIQEWEHKHEKLYQEEANENGLLEWKTLANKDLNEYCREYLHKCVPRRTTHDAMGYKQYKTLYYKRGSENISAFIEMLTCKVNPNRLLFHITRAPETNCVYAVSCTGGYPSSSKVYLINKHCDFEQRGYPTHLKLKTRKTNEISHYHRTTGQPIAINELLIHYELEHNKLCRTKNSCINWPLITRHDITHEYCRNYLQVCVPLRNCNGVTGKWKEGKIKYSIENSDKLNTTEVLQCKISNNATTRHYYLTRAIESNCVYALLRTNGISKNNPFQIVFKHCDFEPIGVKVETPTTSNIFDLSNQPCKKIKIEGASTLETRQLFPVN